MLESWITRFRKNTFQNTLLLGVILFHFIFLVMLLFLSPDSFRKKERKNLIVRTVTPQPPSKIAAVQKTPPRPSSTPKATPAPPPAQKKLPNTPKPEVKKQTAATPPPPKKPAAAKEPAIAEKKLAPAKQPPPKKTPPPAPRAKISDSLLKELEESIAKIENKSDKTAISKKTSTPSRTAMPMTLQIDRSAESDTDPDSKQQNYTDTLIGYLHQSLSLPDYGEVKIQLSLRQDGTVAKVIVLKAKNEKNRQYLEGNLPRLQFPRFDGAWANKKEHTFVLTFCNEQ